MEGVEASMTFMEASAASARASTSMEVSGGSFRGSAINVAVEVSREVSEEQHLLSLASSVSFRQL